MAIPILFSVALVLIAIWVHLILAVDLCSHVQLSPRQKKCAPIVAIVVCICAGFFWRDYNLSWYFVVLLGGYLLLAPPLRLLNLVFCKTADKGISSDSSWWYGAGLALASLPLLFSPILMFGGL